MNHIENIVLVHGSFHNGSCWDLLIPELEKLGFKVSPITLPGHEHKNKPSFTVNLKKYADHVLHTIQKLKTPVILLGHSMGGAVISMVAEQYPNLVKQLIFLSAIVPRKQDTMVKLSKAIPRKEKSLFDKALRLSIKSLINCRISVKLELAKKAFYSEQNPTRQQALMEKTVDQPIRPFYSKISWTDERLGMVKKCYIECDSDKALPIEHQRIHQKNMIFSNIITLKSDHSPFYLIPAQLAQTIKEIIS